MKPFTIVVDTSCDLSPETIREHDIEVVPIPFVLDGAEHSAGYWQDISASAFYDALRGGGTAKTSQINPDAFVKYFTAYAKQGQDAVFILLSSRLSATYQSSQIALGEVRESYPHCGVYPIDSIGATSINALLAMMAVQKRAEGCSAAETAAFLEEQKHNVLGFFTVDDLMYLHRGGRLSKLSAIGGSLLGVKPVLSIQPDGSLALKEKIRGRESALKFLAGTLQRSLSPGASLGTVCIAHSDCQADAQKLAGLVKADYQVRQLEIITLGPVVGAHVGPGAVILVYESGMTRGEYEGKYYGK